VVLVRMSHRRLVIISGGSLSAGHGDDDHGDGSAHKSPCLDLLYDAETIKVAFDRSSQAAIPSLPLKIAASTKYQPISPGMQSQQNERVSTIVLCCQDLVREQYSHC